MGRHTLSLFCSILVISSAAGQDAKYEETIYVDNPYMDHYPTGEWGSEDYCPSGHAFAFDMKYEEPGAVDQTAVNSMKLYCRDQRGAFTGEVTSFEGNYGDWQGMRSCPDANDKISGFRLRIWPYQGTFGDDWAADNIQVMCSSSNTTLDGFGEPVVEELISEDEIQVPGYSISETAEVIEVQSNALIHGDWTNWAYCSDGYYVDGLITYVDQGHPFADDAGLIDIYLYCSTQLK